MMLVEERGICSQNAYLFVVDRVSNGGYFLYAFKCYIHDYDYRIWHLMPLFNNISVVLWQPVLLVEETRVPGENHRPAASH